jgi:hypothetical protein
VSYFHRVGTEFLLGFVTLLSIINPLGISFVFFDMSHWLSQAERTSLARRISVYSFMVILASLITGSTILAFFGISFSALRIAGGLSGLSKATGTMDIPSGQFHLTLQSLDGNGPAGEVTGTKDPHDGTITADLNGPGCSKLKLRPMVPMFQRAGAG